MKKGIESEWKKTIIQKLTRSLLINAGDIATMFYYTISVSAIKDIRINSQYDAMVRLAERDDISSEFVKLVDELSDICECDSQMNRRGRFIYNLKVLYNEFGEYMPSCITDWKVLALYLLICAVKVDENNKDYERIRYLTLYFIALFKIRYSDDCLEVLQRCTLCSTCDCIKEANIEDEDYKKLEFDYNADGGYSYE